MDLGIAGKCALVCGASKGLGRGCTQALVQEGVNLVINGRQPEALAQAAARARGQHAGYLVGQNLLLDGGSNRLILALFNQDGRTTGSIATVGTW